MKKRISIFSALIILCAIPIFCSSCLLFFEDLYKERDYNEVFKNNWEVDLPENMNEEFRKSESNWGHFGTRYAVFTLDEEPAEFLADFAEERDAEIENKVNYLLANADFDISEQYLPIWDNDYCWKYMEYDHSKGELISINKCYIIYFYDSLTLAICQDMESNR